VKSKLGVAGAIAVLLAVPLTVLLSSVVTAEGVVVHFALAAGFVLFALSAFDFRVPRWIVWPGCVAMGALATIFFLQGLTDVTQNDALHRLAYDGLGQTLESVLGDAFLAWCLAVLLFDSRGKTRILGLIVIPLAILVEVYRHAVRFSGELPAGATLLVFLLPVFWLLLESRKYVSREASREEARHERLATG